MIFNSMADSLHVVDADMSIVFMNSHFRTWNASLGLNTKVVGKNIFDTFPFIPEHAKDEYRQVFSTAETLVTQESSFIEDKEIFTETRKIPVIRVEKVVQVITIVRDMTEQVQARDALRRSEEMFRSFIEQSTDGIMLTDEQGRIKVWNQSLEQITGWDKEQISNRYMWDIPSQMLGDVQKDKELHNRLEENIRSFLMRGESPWASKFVEYNIIHKRGDSRTVQVVIFPIKTEMGIVIGSILRDITERVRTDEHLRDALLEKEVLLNELHHRVKNNLAVLISLIDLQAESSADLHLQQAMKALQERIRVIALVHENLYHSQNIARIDFDEYIKDLAKNLFQMYGAAESITLQVDVPRILLDINTALPCGLIVNELVTNALIHAFPEKMRKTGDKIQLTFQEQAGEYILIVSDNGIGLSEWDEGSPSDSPGLTLVDLLVRHQLGGDLNVDTSSGTRFKITFKKEV